MRKTLVVLMLVMTMGLWFVPRVAEAQEGSKETSPAEPAKPKPVQPLQSYRLDFSFNEVADGKTVNTRHYSMNLTAGNSDEIKIGTRVPVATGSSPSTPAPNEYQYIDIGATRCKPRPRHVPQINRRSTTPSNEDDLSKPRVRWHDKLLRLLI